MHPGPQTYGHLGGFGAHYAAAQNHHGARGDPRDAAQQDPPAALLPLQIAGTKLHRETTGNDAHGGEQGQSAVGDYGFIGDRLNLAFYQSFGELSLGGQMQVRK